jgi:translation initiation factor IF-2
MRARGARVTDIAIVVVAADDGVRPQTVEAVAHAKAAGVPIIVALNKVDKEGADVERVKGELAEKAGLVPEEWGGDVPMVPISAKQGTGVAGLLETVALVAELEQLCANPHRAAVGTVLEAHLDRRAGPAAAVLVAAGTLRPGDIVVAGAAYGRVRALSDGGGDVAEAGPSTAVMLTGLNAVPAAGDAFRVAATEQEARRDAEVAASAARLDRLAEAAGSAKVTTMSLASLDDDAGGAGTGAGEEALQRVNVVLKADASGAVEAVRAAAASLPQDRVTLRFLLAAPGDLTLSDVDLASASDALVLGFNVAPSDAVGAAAKQAGVDVRSYRVIYDLLDDLRAAMEGRLSAVDERTPVGTAVVKAVFGGGARRVAGCAVEEGVLRKGCLAVVTRRKRVVAEGTLVSLRRVKDDVNEVGAGLECGVSVAGFNDWAEGDVVAAFDVSQKQRTLEEASADVVPLQASAPEAAAV